jgi:hypothetical protein
MVNWSFPYRHAPGPRLDHQQRQQVTDTLLLISVLLGVLNSGGGILFCKVCTVARWLFSVTVSQCCRCP